MSESISTTPPTDGSIDTALARMEARIAAVGRIPSIAAIEALADQVALECAREAGGADAAAIELADALLERRGFVRVTLASGDSIVENCAALSVFNAWLRTARGRTCSDWERRELARMAVRFPFVPARRAFGELLRSLRADAGQS